MSIFYIYIYKYMPIFTSSSFDKHLVYFHILSIMNNAAKNIECVNISSVFCFYVLWIYTQKKWNCWIWTIFSSATLTFSALASNFTPTHKV